MKCWNYYGLNVFHNGLNLITNCVFYLSLKYSLKFPYKLYYFLKPRYKLDKINEIFYSNSVPLDV